MAIQGTIRTSPTQSAEVRTWMTRIRAAQNKRDKLKHDIWDECARWVKANAKDQFNPNYVSVPLISQMVQAKIARMVIQNPSFNVTAKRRNDQLDIAAEKMKAVLNYFIRESSGRTSFKRQIQAGLYDAFTSLAVWKETYEPEFIKNLNAGKPVIIDGYEIIDDNGEIMSEPDMILVNQHFTTRRVDPSLLLMDVVAKQDGVGGTWDGEEMFVSMADLKSNKKFKNLSD